MIRYRISGPEVVRATRPELRARAEPHYIQLIPSIPSVLIVLMSFVPAIGSTRCTGNALGAMLLICSKFPSTRLDYSSIRIAVYDTAHWGLRGTSYARSSRLQPPRRSFPWRVMAGAI